MKHTQKEWQAELLNRFGDDPMDWAFICPTCKDVATGLDFRKALQERGDSRTASQLLGQMCIGRVLGALQHDSAKNWKGRGCDWCSYGLFQGPDYVIVVGDDTSREVPVFAFAPKP